MPPKRRPVATPARPTALGNISNIHNARTPAGKSPRASRSPRSGSGSGSKSKVFAAEAALAAARTESECEGAALLFAEKLEESPANRLAKDGLRRAFAAKRGATLATQPARQISRPSPSRPAPQPTHSVPSPAGSEEESGLYATSLSQAMEDIDAVLQDLTENAEAMGAVESYWAHERAAMNSATPKSPPVCSPPSQSPSVGKVTRLLQEADAWLAQSAAVGSAREEESVGDADALPAVAAAVVQQSPAKNRRRLLSMRTSSVEQFFMTDTPAKDDAAADEAASAASEQRQLQNAMRMASPLNLEAEAAASLPQQTGQPTTSSLARSRSSSMARSPARPMTTSSRSTVAALTELASPHSPRFSVPLFSPGGETLCVPPMLGEESGDQAGEESWVQLAKTTSGTALVPSPAPSPSGNVRESHAALQGQLQMVVEKLASVEALRTQAEQTVAQLQGMHEQSMSGIQNLAALSLACVAWHAQRDKLEKARQEQLIQQVTQRVVEAQAAAGPDKPVVMEKAALDASEASALESPEPTPGVLRAWEQPQEEQETAGDSPQAAPPCEPTLQHVQSMFDPAAFLASDETKKEETEAAVPDGTPLPLHGKKLAAAAASVSAHASAGAQTSDYVSLALAVGVTTMFLSRSPGIVTAVCSALL